MTRCKAFYDKVEKLQREISDVEAWCEKEYSTATRIVAHMNFCDEHELPIGNISEGSTRPIRSLSKTHPELLECVLEEVRKLERPSTREIELIIGEKKHDISPLMPLQLRVWNVWNFGERTPGQGERGYEWGTVCGQIIENLLWYYTEPGDTVIDPMSGTGTTLDACNRMQRECLAYDKTPMREDIVKRDIYDGLPKKIAQLVFLDPPYFDIMESEHQSYDDWLAFLKTCISHAHSALKQGGYLALILMNKCQKRDNPKHSLVGDAYEILNKHEGLKFENMIATPLNSEMRAFRVARAKEERTMLNLARYIWVFRRDA